MNRYLEAQEYDYNIALQEIKNGRKTSHWIWYIFPQIKGLGYSETAKFYELKSLKEVNEYINNDVLFNRLKDITKELYNLNANNINYVLGDVDALKVKSCMTLFYYVTKDNLFKEVIDKYYNEKMDEKTLNILKNM